MRIKTISFSCLISLSLISNSVLCEEERNEFFRMLRSSLNEVRSGEVLNEPVYPTDFDPPEPKVIIGASRKEIYESLGLPNNCIEFKDCEHLTNWYYDFFKMPPAFRGGGYTLEIVFDKNNYCASSKWIGNR